VGGPRHLAVASGKTAVAVRWHGDALLVDCYIQPRAARDELVGLHNGRLKIRITAAPADGKGNAHLVKFISGLLGLAPRQVSLVRGQTGRNKTLSIRGLDSIPEPFRDLADDHDKNKQIPS